MQIYIPLAVAVTSEKSDGKYIPIASKLIADNEATAIVKDGTTLKIKCEKVEATDTFSPELRQTIVSLKMKDIVIDLKEDKQ